MTRKKFVAIVLIAILWIGLVIVGERYFGDEPQRSTIGGADVY